MIKKIYQTIFSAHFRFIIKQKRLRFYSIIYWGNKYTCNICGKSARKFIKHGHIPRENARCPHCLSLERVRVLWFYLINEIKLERSKLKILHFAPEPGIKSKIKKIQGLTYLTADIDSHAAELQIDIVDIPFEDNTFDLIICSHVLVEVPDEIKAMQELRRVVKKEGTVLIMTQIITGQITDNSPVLLNKKEREQKYGANLCRTHGEDFHLILQKAGFEVDVIDYRKKLGVEAIKKYALGKGNIETIFKCTK